MYSWSGLARLRVTMTTALGVLTSEQRDWIGVGMIIEAYRVNYWACCCFWCYDCTCSTWYTEGKAVGYDVYNSATLHPLANAANITLKALNSGAYTEFGFYLTVLQTNIGVSTNKILLIELIGWGSGSPDPFQYTDQTIDNHLVECQCYTNLGTLDLRTAVAYSTPNCYRRKPQGGYLNYAITVDVSASVNHDLTCFFPDFVVPSFAFNTEIKLVTVNSFPYYVSEAGAYYGGYNKIVSSNTLSPTASAITPGLGVYETPSIYPGAPLKYVGDTLTGAYQITVPFTTVGNEYMPYIYIRFQSGGPIPLHDLCGNNGIFQECRAYNRYLVYVIAAKLFIPLYTVNFVKVANLGYPVSQSARTAEYDTIIYVEKFGYYQSSGVISRSQSQLNVKPVTFYAYPDLFGTAKSGYQTTVVFSFGMAGRNLNPDSTGARFEIKWTAAFTYSKGCVAYVDLTPSVQLDCRVFTNKLWVTSKTLFSTSYTIYVVLGIINPTSNIAFTLGLYEYDRFDGSHYGLTIMQSNTLNYVIDNTEGLAGKVVLPKSSIRMYSFQTKMTRTTSSLMAPLRFWFNLPGTALTPMTWVKTGGGGQLRIDYAQSLNSPYQECFFREYDSWTNLIQHTQSRLFYSDCTSAGGIITVNVPKPRQLDLTKWYELVVMPLSTVYNINTGYNNMEEEVRITAYQVNPLTVWSAQTIQTNKVFYGTSRLNLVSVYYLTVQPQKTTSIQIKFTVSGTYSGSYPQQWFEVLFYDLSMVAFAPTYTYASQLPCVLSATFVSAGNRTFSPRCVLNQYENFVPVVKVRVENIGYVADGTYTIAIDDFSLLDVSALQEPTRRFDIGLVYVNLPNNIYYETFYPEVLLEDGNVVTGVSGPLATFNNPASVQYGAGVVGNINFNYPFDTTVTGLYYDYKMTVRWNGGYSAVWNSIAGLTFGSYSVLWADSINNQVVLAMSTPGHATGFAETLSVTGLTNPYAYQRQIYEFTNSITLTFFSSFYTQTWNVAMQPPYSIYTRSPSLVTVNQTAPTNALDIYNNANTLPPGMFVTWRLQITVTESYANLNLRRLHRYEVRFTSGVGIVSNCWVNDVSWSYYNINAQCQVSQDGLAIELFGFISTRVVNGLNINVRLTVTSSPVQYTSTLYAINNELEYQNSYSVAVALLNSSRTLPTFYGYP